MSLEAENFVFTDAGYLRVKPVSLKRTANRVELLLIYENLTNEDKRMAIYSGGALGKDTMLFDDLGEKWELLKTYEGGAEGPADKIFVPGVPVRVPITFVKETGSLEAVSFTLINWVHILESSGATARPHWTNVTIRDLPARVTQ